MKKNYRYIGLWLCSMLMLLLTACGSSEGESGGEVPGGEGSMIAKDLEIDVYMPNHPVVTRADHGLVEPDEDEMVVNTLDIWVFVHETGEKVGYLSLNESTPGTSGFVGKYHIPVSEDFATEHPNVDVYVVANKASVNLSMDDGSSLTLSKESSREDLQKVIITQGSFGLANPTSELPDAGLPMSGVLKNQVLTVSLPVLKVPNSVMVVRTVSKVRFVFCRTESKDENGDEMPMAINSITLTTLDPEVPNGMIPKQEYLFLDGAYTDRAYRIMENDYEDVGVLSPLRDADNIPICSNPSKYAFVVGKDDQKKGQDYEDLINRGITGEDNEGVPELVQVGRFYLKESDQKITGKINYTIGNGPAKDAEFSMYEKFDFTRNHTWIVYGYFAGKELLKIYSIDSTDWNESSTDHPVYNW